MARIAGVDLPKNKRVEIALTYIYGINITSAKKIVNETKIDKNRRIIDLNDDEIVKLRSILDEKYQIEGDLRRIESINIKRLMEINCYKGKRHRLGLPLRGQRTRTNARTRRGSKKTMANKKKAPKK
uniref:Small ribosomal subunit protein uS13c n=1 Tax=Dichotomaria marginata TaxID=268567 RepID=A0A1G4NSG6_9FLOR|nr:Ribosomal protein S13 [Dichotomaria marginata]SCW21611.1 Ribosomal protein S13 [Dichotomaria marginata]